MIRLIFILVLVLSSTAASAKESVCSASKNTVEDSKCMSEEIDKAEVKLAQYILAAQNHISEDSTIRLALEESQSAWLRYRTVQCGDVYNYESKGTYRYHASAQCMLDLTKERTHDIWSAYLTYSDSTMPKYPEP